jgi:23S rRNA (uracil1939-C5)-methyltransferase
MKTHKKYIEAQVNVESFSKEGRGLGKYLRHDDVACPIEIPFAIPGDVVKVMVLPKRSGIYHSRLLEVIEPSQDRITPKCIHFGVCGGCRFQQISYEKQLELKELHIKRCFPDVPFTMLPAVEIWHHRNKMEFSFSSDTAKNYYLGLIIDSSRGKVVNLSECHLTNPWYIETLRAVRQWWKESTLEAYHPSKNTGALRTLTLREGKRTGDRMVFLTVSGNPEYALNKKQIEEYVSAVRSVEEEGKKLSIFLRIHQQIKGKPTQFFDMHLYGPDHITETLLINDVPLTFTISPSAFFQPNTLMAEKLYNKAIEMIGIIEDKVIYDLYCGTGTLGICMAKKAREVVGIELSADAAYDARNNATLNGLENITIYTGSVEDKLKEIIEDQQHPLPDVVVVDPPRSGLDPRSLEHLKTLNPPAILYVSCNPVSQAKNIADLALAGYRLTSMVAVDQFPHTLHIENIALLSRL